MIRRNWFSIVCASVLVAGVAIPAFVRADDKPEPTTKPAARSEDRPRGPGGPRGERQGPGGRGPSLEQAMGGMGRAFKQLSKQIKDPAQNASSLQLISDIERGAVASKGQVPEKVGKLSGEEKDKQTAEYRKMMISLIEEALRCEEALMDGKNDKAAESVAQLKEMMEQGHKEFTEKKEHGEGHERD